MFGDYSQSGGVSMEKRELVCVACPLGCRITVEIGDDKSVLSVTGNTCKRGEEYAKTECTSPTRMLTTTVKVTGGKAVVVPVKSASPLPKGLLMDCMKVINKASAAAPVKIGDTVISDILGTGVDIIATNNAE